MKLRKDLLYNSGKLSNLKKTHDKSYCIISICSRIISPKWRTLSILNHRTFKMYVLFKVIYACERDIFKTVSQIDFKLEICFYNV